MSKSARISHETVAKFITKDLEAYRTKVSSATAYLSLADIAEEIGSAIDAAEVVVRKMENVAIAEADVAKAANEAEGLDFKLAPRKGKNAGHYPGVRLMDEVEAKALKAKRARESKAADAVEAELASFGIPAETIDVRFLPDGTMEITVSALKQGEETFLPVDTVLALVE